MTMTGTRLDAGAHHQGRGGRLAADLAQLIGLIPAAIYTCDAAGRLTFFNERAVELWGRTPKLGDEQERFCGSFRMWTPGGTLLGHDECPMATAVNEGRAARNVEVVIEQPAGSRIVANVNIDPLYDDEGRIAGAINVFMDVTESQHAAEALRQNERLLRRTEIWDAAQKNAFQAAMNEAPLDSTLEILIRAAIELAGDDRRCALYISDGHGRLHHVAGMPDTYAQHIDGFEISPESLACSLAVARGEPVITPDVLEEPRWQPWTWLAREHGYRGCWSFPVETATGKPVGSFAMYFGEPREPTARDLDLAAAVTKSAAILISRHQESQERARIERALRQSEERQAAFLLRLSDALRPLADPMEAQRVAMRLLGDLLKAEQTFYYRAERTGDGWVHIVDEDYFRAPGMPARVGRRAQSEFGEALFAPLAQGEAVIVADVHALDGLTQRQRDNFRSANLRSFVVLPVIKNGRYVAGVSAQSSIPRTWAAHEIVLVQDVAERTWAAAERARAEAALRERETTLHLLFADLQHRVRNILATVRAIASRTGRTQNTVADFQAHLDGRLAALGRTQSVLTRFPGAGVDLEILIREELLAQAASEKQFSLGGCDIRLSPKAAEVVTLAIHELATNATKYGALAQQRGRIGIEWGKIERDDGTWLSLGWTESGVRLPKEKPPRQGFGTELITRRIPHELQGEGAIEFGETGVKARIAFPLRDGQSTLETGFPWPADGSEP